MWRFPFVRLVSAAAGVVVALAGVLYMARAPVLQWVGTQLIRNDRLVPADAIAVLAGSAFAERELEAADLYHAGYAERIVLAVGREAPGAIEMARRGVELSSPLEIRLGWLAALGVPKSAVGVLSGRAESTFDEAVLFAAWCDQEAVDSLIVVTSAFHTARAGYIFEQVFGDRLVRLSFRAASLNDFTPDTWWRQRTTLRTGLFELQRMAFYRLVYW